MSKKMLALWDYHSQEKPESVEEYQNVIPNYQLALAVAGVVADRDCQDRQAGRLLQSAGGRPVPAAKGAAVRVQPDQAQGRHLRGRVS